MFFNLLGNENNDAPSSIRQLRPHVSRAAAVAGMAALSLSGCNALTGQDGFSDEEWKEIRRIEPLSTPMPTSPFNLMADNLDLARFGQALFFETDVAEPSMTDGPR